MWRNSKYLNLSRIYYDYIETIEAICASFHARLDQAKILFPNGATLVKFMPPGMATSHAWFLWAADFHFSSQFSSFFSVSHPFPFTLAANKQVTFLQVCYKQE